MPASLSELRNLAVILFDSLSSDPVIVSTHSGLEWEQFDRLVQCEMLRIARPQLPLGHECDRVLTGTCVRQLIPCRHEGGSAASFRWSRCIREGFAANGVFRHRH